MSILVIFTVYRLCPVKRNSQTVCFFPYFWGALESLSNVCHVLQLHFCQMGMGWSWAKRRCGALAATVKRDAGWSNTYCCLGSCCLSLQCLLCFVHCLKRELAKNRVVDSHYGLPTSHCNASIVCRYAMPAHELPANDFPIFVQANLRN